VAPKGGAVHSGTFNAHLIPILAANAFLDEMAKPEFWSHLEQVHGALCSGLREVFKRAGLPVWVQALGARFSLLFGLDEEPRSYRQAARYNRDLARRFYAAALEAGAYYYAGWHHGLSVMHTMADVEEALERTETAARRVARG
jgi:glutamate-1-semialdehyde 2,1-aminomutase